MPKLESNCEQVVNPKRKTKPFLINETQEDDRFVIDEDHCDWKIEYWLPIDKIFWVFPSKKYSLNSVKLRSTHILKFQNRQNY